jgi:hypothetical protein
VLLANGSVVAWGAQAGMLRAGVTALNLELASPRASGGGGTSSQASVAGGWQPEPHVVQLVAGYNHALALLSNGSLVPLGGTDAAALRVGQNVGVVPEGAPPSALGSVPEGGDGGSGGAGSGLASPGGSAGGLQLSGALPTQLLMEPSQASSGRNRGEAASAPGQLHMSGRVLSASAGWGFTVAVYEAAAPPAPPTPPPSPPASMPRSSSIVISTGVPADARV